MRKSRYPVVSVLLLIALMLFSTSTQAASPTPDSAKDQGTPTKVSAEVVSHQNAVETALGKEKADLVLRGGHVLDVFTGTWMNYYPGGADIVIRGDRIAWVGPAKGWTGVYTDTKIVDITGLAVVPSFGEVHIHIESSHLSPSQFAKIALVRGSTWVMEASHEAGNPFTVQQNAEFWLQPQDAGSPLKIYPQLASAAPPTPFEHTPGGDSNGYTAVYNTMRADNRVFALDEVMNGPAWMQRGFYGYDFLWGLIQSTWDAGGIVEGHGSHMYSLDLINALAASGLATDHEVSDGAESLAKLQRGVDLNIRTGDMAAILPYLLSAGLRDWSHVAVTTDDRSVEDVLNPKLGSMDYNIRQAISYGVPVEVAYSMGSYYPAQMMHLERDLGSVAPGRFADLIVLAGDPREVKIHQVYANGKLAAEDGNLVATLPEVTLPKWATDTMNVGRELTAADFAVKAPEGKATVTAALLSPFYFAPTYMTATMTVTNGLVQSDPAQGIEKFCMVDRYNKLSQPVACMFWKEVGPLTPDTAVAATESHDNHNVHVDSNSDSAAAMAVNELTKIGGGYVFVSGGKVIAEVPLEVAGLMSDRSPEVVAKGFTDFWKSMENYKWLGGGIPTIVSQKFATLTCTPWQWVLVPPFADPVKCPSGFVNVTTGECHAVVW
jgi:adenine deaminase